MSAAGETLIFSVRLASGDFESELRMPLPLTPAEQKRAVEQWLDIMATGLRVNAKRLDVALNEGAAE